MKRGAAGSARMLFVALVATSACNAILGNEAKLSFDEEADGGADGGAPAGDGAVLGEGSDQGEGSVVTDSGAEAEASGCDATFCSDFDPPLDVAPFGWSGLTPVASQFVANAAASTTAPFSLVVTGANADPNRYLRLDLARSGPAAYSFDFLAVHIPLATSVANFFQLTCASGVVLKLGFETGTFYFFSGPNVLGGDRSAVPLPENQWKRVTVLTEAQGSSLVIDGVKHGIVATCLDPAKVELGLGSIIVDGPDEWRVRFDHFVIAF